MQMDSSKQKILTIKHEITTVPSNLHSRGKVPPLQLTTCRIKDKPLYSSGTENVSQLVLPADFKAQMNHLENSVKIK